MNAYYERLAEGLFFQLQTGDECSSQNRKVLIAMYLYYDSSVEWCKRYIEKLHLVFDIVIITSTPKIYTELSEYSEDKIRCQTILKDNVGRDISALLVTLKEAFYQYDYLCFLHDKKEKEEKQKQDVYIWMKSMWDNLIYSAGYINRVINLMDEKKIGLALPAIDIGFGLAVDQNGSWYNNYENTVGLLNKMNIKSDIDERIPPISFGTMFWCKTATLHKLLELDWKDEDFPKEPLADDGEINHAVERVLPYVVQNAGYKTATIMTDNFVPHYIAKLNHYLRMSLFFNGGVLGIKYLSEMYGLLESLDEVKKFVSKYKKVYLYGAGKKGRQAYNILAMLCEFIPDGFIDRDRSIVQCCGLRVLSIENITDTDNTGIIIAVGKKYLDEVKTFLESSGFRNNMVLFREAKEKEICYKN